MTKVKQCPICHSEKLFFNIEYDNTYWPDIDLFDKLEIISCKSCGFSFSWPELSDSDVDLFYESYYRGKGSPFYINFAKLKESFRLSSRSLAQVLLSKQFINFKEKDVFLDIGPGDGSSFMVARNSLLNPKMYAVELNEGSSIAYKKVYGISTFKNLEEVERSNIKAKIILLSHSLEHIKLSQLSYLLEMIGKIIDNEGAMLIEVPLVDMRKHKLIRSQDAPHFLFFSKDSIKILLEKHGWKIIFCNSVSKEYSSYSVYKKSQKTFFIKLIAKIVNKAVRILPLSAVRILSRCINKMAIDEQFSYGGDRMCLRVVATLDKKSLNEI
jgi:hypothetical protein